MRIPTLLAFVFSGFCVEAAPSAILGSVTDASGASVDDAEVEIRNASGSIVWQSRTGKDGRFRWTAAHPGYYQVHVAGEKLDSHESVIYAPAADAETELRIVLRPRSVYTRITVTALRGGGEDAQTSPQLAFSKDQADLRKRPAGTLGEILAAEPGVLVQQSTAGQVSPFLRGLTGYQVLNLMDGIRFNNSTFRSGPNQYLAFLEPHQAQRVEALLGPTGVQYGSDSLGGTINVITTAPSFHSDRRGWTTHGDFFLGGATADLSATGAARYTVASSKLFWLIGASGRKHNDLRAGGGYDSRNVFHRFFGMPAGSVKELLGGRQQDSGFRQYGAETRFALRPAPGHLVTLNYQRGVQDQVRGYKDLLGGLGRVQSDFDPQIMNWFYARYEKTGAGPLDSVSGTFSFNNQVDGSIRRNLLYSDPLTRDWNRVNVYGYSGQATMHRGNRLLASFGGDIYDENVASERIVTDTNGRVTRPRPLYPDRSGYQTFGTFSQASIDLTRRVRASGGVRYTGVHFATRQDAALNVPASSQWFRDFTFQSSIRWQIMDVLGVHGTVSRGFRAPNLNDLGALGLNDLGYEIPASAALVAGALLSTDSGEGALSKATALRPLKAESLMNYEFGVRVNHRLSYTRVQFFDAELYDPIVRRTLLFPSAAAPSQLAGLPVAVLPPTANQRAQGVVTVATELDPRAVKAFANDGRSRYYGAEVLGHYVIRPWISLEANYSYILGRDLNPNRNVRRLPPQSGAVTLRYTPAGRRPWIEWAVMASGSQDRLSGGDVDDERIGASFRRSDIAAFFRGARVALYVDPVTGVFRPTGETLLQIQNRVLPAGSAVNGVRVTDDAARVPLYLSTAGWATVSLRSGFPVSERWRVNAAVENLLDRNYRTHGSGVDAPGFSIWAGVGFRF